MPRSSRAVLTVAALTAGATLVAAGPSGASTRTHRAVRPATSVALLASGNATFRAARAITGSKPHHTATFRTRDLRSVATVIDGNGNDALVCSDSNHVSTVRHLRTRPRRGPAVDGSPYGSEGGATFGFFCDGVAVHGAFALAAGDSLGVLQLVRRHGVWKADRRVRSAGVNEAGHPHVPGWIRFPRALPADEFNSVSIAPAPLHGGAYLAVAFDRVFQTMVVVKGVGTSKPRVVGSLVDPLLANGRNAFGDGGVAWQPGARDHALITTTAGFAVLDLRHPSKPRLRAVTKVGRGDLPTSITVSPDGDHLAVSAGRRVFGYGRVRAAVAHGRRPRLQTSFRLGRRHRDAALDVAYTAHGNLLVLHGGAGDGWALTVVRKVPRGHHAVRGSMHTTAPFAGGSLSVWPVA